MTNKEKVALYHAVYANEDYEKARKDLLTVVRMAQNQTPDLERILYIDIDGHRNQAGGYDKEMMRLQQDFCLGFLLKYVKEVHLPIGVEAKNPGPQKDLPMFIQ